MGELRNEGSFLPQRRAETPESAPAATAPPGMVRIPAGTFDFVVSGIEIEGGPMVGVDVQYAWEDSPRRHHQKRLDLKAFYIDRHPVTNAEFERFLKASGIGRRTITTFSGIGGTDGSPPGGRRSR